MGSRRMRSLHTGGDVRQRQNHGAHRHKRPQKRSLQQKMLTVRIGERRARPKLN